MEALKEYPNAKVVGEVYGQATTEVAQSEVSNILPSLPQVDAVLTQGRGDDYGVVQAFEQAGKKMPIVEGGGSSSFLKWCLSDGTSDPAAQRRQQALMSRALIDRAEVILLNDPTRGVDIGVKREFYQVLLDVAAEGKLIVWYSSEDAEFLECSRVLVLRRGKIATEISGRDASRENLGSVFFASPETATWPRKVSKRAAHGEHCRVGWCPWRPWSSC
jgi:hypothetical protein